jgi:hypothetical protein
MTIQAHSKRSESHSAPKQGRRARKKKRAKDNLRKETGIGNTKRESNNDNAKSCNRTREVNGRIGKVGNGKPT